MASPGSVAVAQQSLLHAGPMPGYISARESVIWVQTSVPAKVEMRYWEKGQSGREWKSVQTQTERASACTAHLTASEVDAGFTYEYEILINDQPCTFKKTPTFKTQEVWTFRSDPPLIRFAVGSCAFTNETAYDRPGAPYGGDNQIFESIQRKSPDFMVWLGDNVYYRAADWTSRSGMMARYSYMRRLPEIQSLLRSTHHYAIWDDHDYGPNDSDRSFTGKADALDVFQMFWANPSYGLPGKADPTGIISQFSYADIDFFMLDNRWFRSPNNLKSEERSILGAEQINWLIEAMVASKATFKFVVMGGQLLNPSTVWETYANVAPEEREEIIRRISAEDLENVVFITGDRHHSELSRLELSSGNTLLDVTVSPLTATPHAPGPDEINTLLVDGSLINQRNFAIVTVGGAAGKRTLSMEFYDSDGKLLWSNRAD